MNFHFDTPERSQKPRQAGLTSIIDKGYPFGYFQDVVESFHPYIDCIKFGWCTAYVTPDIEKKIQLAKQYNIVPFLGGTFFELAYLQNKLDEFKDLLHELELSHMEVSNGSIDLSQEEKAEQIPLFTGDFTVFSEVGYKDTNRSDAMRPQEWITAINQDIAAGASYVITEAREGGTSGICSADGDLRVDLIDYFINAGVKLDQLIFEAPTKSMQAYFIKQFGSETNMGNIPFADVISLETLRLRLRCDTL